MMEIRLRQPYSFCHLGRRANQEDARFPNENAPQNCKPAFVVCDGVGGQDKGEIASRIIADTIGEEMMKVDLSRLFAVKDFEYVFAKAYSVFKKNMKENCSEMATTLTFVCFHGAGAFVAHIGDSRIYHIRPDVGILYQSDDHSLINSLVHSGNLTPEEAENHPQSNIITRCISKKSVSNQSSGIDTYQITDIEPNDYFFLCTDGVTRCLSDGQLLSILSSKDSDSDKIKVIASICEGSSDNNTAYLIGIEDTIFDVTELDKPIGEIEKKTNRNTHSLNIPNEVIIEASTGKKRSLKNQLSTFFNKLF